MIFRPSREGGSIRLLELRAALLLLGAGVGLAGMLYDRIWMVNLGIGILAAGIIVGLVIRRRS